MATELCGKQYQHQQRTKHDSAMSDASCGTVGTMVFVDTGFAYLA